MTEDLMGEKEIVSDLRSMDDRTGYRWIRQTLFRALRLIGSCAP